MIFYKDLGRKNNIDLHRLLKIAVEVEEVVCLLNSNSYSTDKYSSFHYLLAIGEHKRLKFKESESIDIFEELVNFHKRNGNLMLGFFSYDSKNSIENLNSVLPDFVKFPDIYFFVPKLVFKKDNTGNISILISDSIYETLAEEVLNAFDINFGDEIIDQKISLQFKTRFSKAEYVETIHKIKQHIQQGDIYEMNFCQEFYCENSLIDPVQTYWHLNSVSEMPFSSFLKLDSNYLLCASPERYMRKIGQMLISQPIKGTAKRGNSRQEDENLKVELQNNEKERAENIMIVDLVRNDLSRTATPKTVEIEELCKIYSFPFVHQMISTVKSVMSNEYNWADTIKYSFPMGSMTGAPKIKSMELIELYEKSKRGLYSGALGYVDEKDDFDFNVVIRSLQYNATDNYLSFFTGGAITIKSNAESEYQECMLKAEAIFKALQNE